MRRLGLILAIGAAIFMLTGLAVVIAKITYRMDHVYGLYALFDLDSDSSIPTWFSSLGLLACSVLLWLNARIDGSGKDWLRWQWHILAIVFLVLSIDEVARLHEVLGTLVGQELVPAVSDRSGGVLSYEWLVAGIAFTGLLALAYIPFLYRLPWRVALGFMVSGCVYVGGAALMESFNGHIGHTSGYTAPLYLFGTVVEETLEMSGVALFAHVLVRHLGDRTQLISLAGVFAPGD